MPRGVSRKADLSGRAHELRDRGWTGPRIAQELGVGRSTVYAWFGDPDLSKQKARRQRYSRPCVDCGAPTDGSGGYADPAIRCQPCRHAYDSANAIWTREAITDAVHAWVAENGRIPGAMDWFPTLAAANGHPEKVEKFYADDAWPWYGTVVRMFGSWNALIVAAGYEPRARGQRDSERCIDLELAREVSDRYEAGESSWRLAEAYGVTPGTALYWIKRSGGRIRSMSEAQQLRRHGTLERVAA